MVSMPSKQASSGPVGPCIVSGAVGALRTPAGTHLGSGPLGSQPLAAAVLDACGVDGSGGHPALTRTHRPTNTHNTHTAAAMEVINFPPPNVHRVRWENRRVRGSGGKVFNEAVILARGGTRCYLLLRLLAHDKPHVATMLACRVREDRVSGAMVQEPDAHVVIKVRCCSLANRMPWLRARRGRPAFSGRPPMAAAVALGGRTQGRIFEGGWGEAVDIAGHYPRASYGFLLRAPRPAISDSPTPTTLPSSS